MSTFTPRPYPPPMLADVPYEYVVDKLRDLAPTYWKDVHTSDCTIVIPNSTSSISISPSASSPETSRRATEPTLPSLPRSFYHSHVDYLSCQSTLLRGVLSGASALNLISHMNMLGSSASYSTVPYLLPSPTPSHPVICLPVPDPSSFELLLHWMYFGDVDILAEALYNDAVSWQGLAQNAIYLGLPPTLLEFLQDWISEGEEEMEDDSDEDAGLTEDAESSESDDDDSWGMVSSDDEKVEWTRGRSRTRVVLSTHVKK